MVQMPRRNRCVLPGVPCHITQRGVDGRPTFSSDLDRAVYLRLLRENLRDAAVHLLGWCLMPNHVHLVATPDREDSLAILLRRVQGRYAQYFNTQTGRIGHLWQNRFFACVLDGEHLWTALAYVDRNPVRAGMVRWAGDYRWSSAMAHATGIDEHRMVDMDWWRAESRGEDWAATVDSEELRSVATLRQCTFAGRPFGSAEFMEEMSRRFERSWVRGRPKKAKSLSTKSDADQADKVFSVAGSSEMLRRSG
jgi:putative transposase